MAKTKKLFAALTRRGPHRPLRGDLAFAGLPGVVYTPESGMTRPGVAFGHDWLTAAGRYHALLEHLASWGIVAAAPNSETGFAPSVLNLSFDLGSTLDVITGVRLGTGKISVHPSKLGVVGHGFGGSAAVFTAAGLPHRLKAAAALFPAVTRPAAAEPAASLSLPGLILAAPEDRTSLRASAHAIGDAWSTATLRTVAKAEAGGIAGGRRFGRVFGLPGADRRTQKSVRALLTGFLLYTLAGDKTYRDFADPDVVLPRTVAPDPEAPAVAPEDKIVALLKR